MHKYRHTLFSNYATNIEHLFTSLPIHHVTRFMLQLRNIFESDLLQLNELDAKLILIAVGFRLLQLDIAGNADTH